MYSGINFLSYLQDSCLPLHVTVSSIQKPICYENKNRSGKQILKCLYWKVLKASHSEGKVVGAIFIDFRKAFDSVSHDILYYKMHASGLSGKLLCWLKSYLSSRWQFVDLNGFKSPLLEVKYGVPQGSLLGPRLFSIYVNDFSESISKGELHLYADDTTAFVIGNSTDEVVVKLNLLFEEIHTWCQHYKLFSPST